MNSKQVSENTEVYMRHYKMKETNTYFDQFFAYIIDDEILFDFYPFINIKYILHSRQEIYGYHHSFDCVRLNRSIVVIRPLIIPTKLRQ